MLINQVSLNAYILECIHFSTTQAIALKACFLLVLHMYTYVMLYVPFRNFTNLKTLGINLLLGQKDL